MPFLASWKPSARAKALGAPVEIDISKLEPGAHAQDRMARQAGLVVRRTPEMLESIGNHDARLADPGSKNSRQPDYAKNPARAIKPEFLVLVGVCTHLGCLPQNRFAPGASATASWPPTGRAASSAPATARSSTCPAACSRACRRRSNLEIPPYAFADDNHLVIGVDKAKEA